MFWKKIPEIINTYTLKVSVRDGCFVRRAYMVHAAVFGKKIKDFSSTFQGLKSFFQGVLFPNNMK